jgi:Sulfotransferase domain
MGERPDFVIAGAARSGTTALFEYLSHHPSVCVPREKEPAFFSVDVRGGIRSLEEYRDLFAHVPQHCVTGEASTPYLYSRVAIARLIAYNPSVKVIVMLRNPVNAAYSLHGFAYFCGHEDIADFEEAWRTQPARLARDSRLAGRIFDYDYRTVYGYPEQVRRVLEHVPPAQRLFVVYEEFFADPATHYAKVLQFLGLPLAPSPDFRVVHPYVAVRSPGVERMLRQPPRVLRALYAPTRTLFETAGWSPAQLIKRINRARKPPMRPSFRLELERYFAHDIAELEALLQRRLWQTRRREPGVRW